MTQKEVYAIPTKDQLMELLESLNLSDRQREVFLLRFARKWTMIEIATELGYCVGTVKKDCRVIKRKLKCI